MEEVKDEFTQKVISSISKEELRDEKASQNCLRKDAKELTEVISSGRKVYSFMCVCAYTCFHVVSLTLAGWSLLAFYTVIFLVMCENWKLCKHVCMCVFIHNIICTTQMMLLRLYNPNNIFNSGRLLLLLGGHWCFYNDGSSRTIWQHAHKILSRDLCVEYIQEHRPRQSTSQQHHRCHHCKKRRSYLLTCKTRSKLLSLCLMFLEDCNRRLKIDWIKTKPIK